MKRPGILTVAFETNSFRRHETLYNGEKCLDKKQNKARTKHEENRWILSFGRQNLAESDKGSWFNRLSESEATSASSLNVSAVSKKKIMESRRKQCYERATSINESGLFFVVGFFIVRNKCLLAFLKLRCGTFSSVCFVEVRFFPFVLSFVDHG